MKKLARGVTLIEVAVVLVVMAILFMQAAPQFSAWMQNVQIRTAAESMQNGLQLARSEAIRRNRSVMFWLTSATNQADWLVGCSNPVGAGVQPEAPGDCPGSSTTAGAPVAFNWIQRQLAADQQTALPVINVVPAGATNVTFNSLGMVLAANADGTAPIQRINVTLATAGAQTRNLQINVAGGQIRMCDPNLALATDPRGCQ